MIVLHYLELVKLLSSMSSGLFTCVLFVSLMKSVNGAHFSNIIYLLTLFTAAPSTAVFALDIVPLTSTYASL